MLNPVEPLPSEPSDEDDNWANLQLQSVTATIVKGYFMGKNRYRVPEQTVYLHARTVDGEKLWCRCPTELLEAIAQEASAAQETWLPKDLEGRIARFSGHFLKDRQTGELIGERLRAVFVEVEREHIA